MHIRKGDTVIVLSGNDRGRTGEVKRVFPTKRKVIVEGVNMRWKHKRATQSTPKGERIQEERWVRPQSPNHQPLVSA